MPFLAVMANPEGSTVIKAMKPLFRFFGAEQQTEMVIVLTGLFATTAVASGGLRLALLWASNAYANGMAYELAVKLYDNVLHEPY